MSNQWQPIETAPKDGTKFLAYGRGSPSDAILYDDPKDMSMQVRVCWRLLFDSEREEDAGGGLYRKAPYVHDLGWKGGVHFTPTHWMPLPAPPREDV